MGAWRGSFGHSWSSCFKRTWRRRVAVSKSCWERNGGRYVCVLFLPDNDPQKSSFSHLVLLQSRSGLKRAWSGRLAQCRWLRMAVGGRRWGNRHSNMWGRARWWSCCEGRTLFLCSILIWNRSIASLKWVSSGDWTYIMFPQWNVCSS